MDRGWRLGAHEYAPVGDLPAPAGGGACTWSVVRRDGEGPRLLLQLWEPRPPGKVLDTLREEFLHRFSQAEALDAGACHLGFDEERLWFLQELSGVSLQRCWGEADADGRAKLQARLTEALAASRVPRFLAPEVIGLKPGRILVPRVLGTAPWKPADLLRRLQDEPPAPADAGAEAETGRPWEEAPDLADATWVPIRGRGKELTYLKSLMFGLNAAIPMERVLILQGEVGLGHDRLCDWAAAAAETEGLWVANLPALPGEKAGGFLERMLQDLLLGLEADLYAAAPAVARALSRRLSTFAFLRGGRRAGGAERPLDPEETGAALAALAFAQARHSRLIQVRGLERATPEVHDLLKELVLGSKVPWILSCRGGGQEPGAKSCLMALRNSPAAATVVLDRLEDRHLPEVLADLLGAHDLPRAYLDEVCAASLGNPGLMQGILEMAQVRGCLVRAEGRWTFAGGVVPEVKVKDGLVQGILAGRLQRVSAAAQALVRYLALMDGPLPLGTLGRALGLDGDGVEEALQAAVSAKLVLTGDGSARIANGQVRDLALAKMLPQELQRWARVLLKLMEEETGRPVLSVRLQTFARDRETALAQVLLGIRRELPGPRAAARIVEEALQLGPDGRQKALLYEFLSDNWTQATEGDAPPGGEPGQGPQDLALEALAKAIEALAEGGQGEGEDQPARFLRKKGMLELRLRRFADARASFDRAGACLVDHPFHPEQPRLRLGLGKLQLLQGNGARGIATLEEGLLLLGQKSSVEGHQDQAALLLALGQALGQRAQFQRAMATLDSARRVLEHLGDQRRLVGVLDALGQLHLAIGQPDTALQVLKEALGMARILEDMGLQGTCHLQLGILHSTQQSLGPALGHLDSALRRFEALGDRALAAQTQAWKARTLAAMGDTVLAELVLLRASGLPAGCFTPLELGDRTFLDGELAGFREAWEEARRHFQAAANRYEDAGLAWRERLARLRCIQAEAMVGGGAAGLKSAWIRLEGLKGTVEASGSRWLELEWHRAHALLLSLSGTEEAVIAQALLAWGEVLAGARELRFPVLALEASARSAELLLGRGEKLGARSRIQDALPSFQLLWSRLPHACAPRFLGRKDIHGFRTAAERSGMPFHLPERVDPLADWSPTQANLPVVPSTRANP